MCRIKILYHWSASPNSTSKKPKLLGRTFEGGSNPGTFTCVCEFIMAFLFRLSTKKDIFFLTSQNGTYIITGDSSRTMRAKENHQNIVQNTVTGALTRAPK